MEVRSLLLVAGAALAIASSTASAQKPIYGDWGYNAAAMDSSVKPGDDFFAYVTGTSGSKRRAYCPLARHRLSARRGRIHP